MSDYQSVADGIGRLAPVASKALYNDVVENALVLARLQALSGTLLPVMAGAVMADLFAVNTTVHTQLGQINNVLVGWLSKSSSSDELLAQAVADWEGIAIQQSDVIAELAAGRNRLTSGEWSGIARGEHLAEAAKKQAKEATFAESLARLVDGCQQSQDLTGWIMLKAFTAIDSGELAASGAANVGPSAGSGKPRNWRLRAVAAEFGTIHSSLTTLQSKSEWGEREQAIVRIFQKHAATLRELQSRTWVGPKPMFAV